MLEDVPYIEPGAAHLLVLVRSKSHAKLFSCNSPPVCESKSSGSHNTTLQHFAAWYRLRSGWTLTETLSGLWIVLASRDILRGVRLWPPVQHALPFPKFFWLRDLWGARWWDIRAVVSRTNLRNILILAHSGSTRGLKYQDEMIEISDISDRWYLVSEIAWLSVKLVMLLRCSRILVWPWPPVYSSMINIF